MKRNFFFIITLLISITANSQANYYYYDGNKIDLDMNINYVNVLSDTDFDYNSIPDIQVDTLVTNKTYMWYKIHFININDKVEFYSKRNQLLNNNHIKHIAYYYGNLNDEPVGTSNIFYVKLKNIQDINELENLCGQNNVELVKQVPYMPFWFKLKSKTFITSIELANLFYQYDIIDEIDVGFDIKYTIPILSSSSNTQTTPNTSNSSNCVNDTDFNLQWGLENLINPDIDINACDAWNISKGNNVKVAIVDTGIDTTNSDLVNTEINFYNSFFDQVLTQPYTTYGHHGTMMAGTIGAIQNNSYKISGVAPECLMMDVMFSDLPGQNAFPNRGEALAACISYAWQNEADVINCSWGDRAGHLQDVHSPLLIQALNNAATQGRNGRGCVVVFASGNQYQNINYPPINFNKALCVGGIDINGERAIWGGGLFESSFGNRLDLVAPCKDIPYLFSSYFPPPMIPTPPTWSGTSFSSAYTSGVAALILSVNPCLTEQQVRDIIEKTAKKIRTDIYNYDNIQNRPNGTWNNEMGYGLLDAYAAVQMAQQMYNASIDLYIKDRPDDLGIEPNPTPDNMWTSEDIWVRNQDDGQLTHQNPEYDPNNPVYVYVRVKNKGCTASTGQDKLHLYWANANTGLSWPVPWTGQQYNGNQVTGGEFGSVPIPPLNSGDEAILHIPWDMSNIDLSNFQQTSNGHWHFCLLARIVSSSDPMTYPETNDINANVRNNNNIAWKNVSMVDILPNNDSSVPNNIVSVAISNPYDTSHNFYLELVKDDKETGKPIYVESEVKVKMDDILYNAWQRGGKIAEEMENTSDEKKIIVKNNNALIKNINFGANEAGLLTLDFNFLTEEMTDKDTYTYHLIQKDAVTNKVIGGETFIIHKQTRPVFVAQAEDKEIDKNETITISAEDINEAATYNWYDEQGNLVYQGGDLTVSPEIAKKYKLEVIATADGFKDYKEVDVKLKPSRIINVSPNPTSDTINVEYKVNNNETSYIMIIGTYGGSNDVNNYLIDVDSDQISIDISNYQTGYYTVALVNNGQIVDAKSIQKN